MSKKKNPTETEPTKPLRKAGLALDLMRRAGGASLAEITEATGWLPHSTRAVLTGFRKRGFALDKSKVEGVTRYSITAEPAA
ncbi:MAG: DUF3489 domain-containing protein [Sphingomicrobium sp.]